MAEHKAVIQYFKSTGKYYAEAELELLPEELTDNQDLAIMFKISDRLKLLSQQGGLPGLSFTNNWLEEGYIYVNVPDIGYPCLLIAGVNA